MYETQFFEIVKENPLKVPHHPNLYCLCKITWADKQGRCSNRTIFGFGEAWKLSQTVAIVHSWNANAVL